jgi:hypothetical protein
LHDGILEVPYLRVARTPHFTGGTSDGPWLSACDQRTDTAFFMVISGGSKNSVDHPAPADSAFWELDFAAEVAAARYERVPAVLGAAGATAPKTARL